eukprot:c16927_g1_i1.p1 GENE.c16927_g1_i1~~c16927_g1_i1.p1  ORF type:complete len:364 (-),score=156.72 c16927_g1_i1:50-1141(-)
MTERGEANKLPSSLLVEFSVGKSLFDEIENQTGNRAGLDKLVSQAISCFWRAQAFAKQEAIFSPNEVLEDINTESLKYLLIPYYLAELYSKESNINERLKSIKESERLFNVFLCECENREIMSAEDRSAYVRETEDAGVMRQEKISRYKREKELQEKLKRILETEQRARLKQQNEDGYDESNLASTMDSESTEREFVLALIHIAIGRSLTNLKTLKQEIEIVTKMIKNINEAEFRQPSRSDPRIAQRKAEEVVATLRSDTWDLTSDMRARVFTSGLSKPSITLEEFAEVEKEHFDKKQAMMKEMEKNRVKLDPDTEEAIDLETLKTRYWDDWRDNHEKGAGNTGLKSMFDVAAFQQENPGTKL